MIEITKEENLLPRKWPPATAWRQASGLTVWRERESGWVLPWHSAAEEALESCLSWLLILLPCLRRERVRGSAGPDEFIQSNYPKIIYLLLFFFTIINFLLVSVFGLWKLVLLFSSFVYFFDSWTVKCWVLIVVYLLNDRCDACVDSGVETEGNSDTRRECCVSNLDADRLLRKKEIGSNQFRYSLYCVVLWYSDVQELHYEGQIWPRKEPTAAALHVSFCFYFYL